MTFFGNNSGGGGNHHHHHHHLHGSYGAISGKKEEDDASVVKETQRFAFFRGRKSKLVLGAIGTGLAVVGCASAYFSSSSSALSSPFSSSLLPRGGLLGSSASSFLGQATDIKETNLVLCKIPKIGGTTLAGVGRRIGENYGLSGVRDGEWITTEPGVWMDHMSFQEGLADKIHSLTKAKFVFTIIRQPVGRMISNYQYTFMDPKFSEDRVRMCYDNTHNPACRLPLPQTREEIEQRLIEYVENANINIERDYCMPQAAIDEKWSLQRIMDNLDFIGITERFDENLIVFMEYFNLKFADILYLSANVIEYDWGGSLAKSMLGKTEDGKENKVIENHATNAATLGGDTLSPETQAKVEELMKDSSDFEMWELANAKLDEIVGLIPDFRQKLKTFTAYRSAAQEYCAEYADGTGDASQCMYRDEGCGQTCLNEFAANENNLAQALLSAQTLEEALDVDMGTSRSIFDFGS